MTNYSNKRIIAYAIDIIIVAFVSSLITLAIPVSDSYTNAAQDYVNTITDFANNKTLLNAKEDTEVWTKE